MVRAEGWGFDTLSPGQRLKLEALTMGRARVQMLA